MTKLSHFESMQEKIKDMTKDMSLGDMLSRSMPNLPEISMPPMIRPPELHLASDFYSKIIKTINDFDQELDDEHEVGVRLVSFGRDVTFHLTEIGYWNPALIIFHGWTEVGDPVQLIQHVTQISVLLIKMRRSDPSKPKQPIGFMD